MTRMLTSLPAARPAPRGPAPLPAPEHDDQLERLVRRLQEDQPAAQPDPRPRPVRAREPFGYD